MLQAILNKSGKQHSTKQQLCGHLPTISKTKQLRRTRHAKCCSRRKGEHISDVLLCTPSHERTSVERPTRTYQQQRCMDTRCSHEDQPNAMDDKVEWRERERERERVREIRTSVMMISEILVEGHRKDIRGKNYHKESTTTKTRRGKLKKKKKIEMIDFNIMSACLGFLYA